MKIFFLSCKNIIDICSRENHDLGLYSSRTRVPKCNCEFHILLALNVCCHVIAIASALVVFAFVIITIT